MIRATVNSVSLVKWLYAAVIDRVRVKNLSFNWGSIQIEDTLSVSAMLDTHTHS